MTQSNNLSLGMKWQLVRWFMLLPIVILLSALSDLRYYAFGKVTDAELVSAFRGRQGDPDGQKVIVRYTFKDLAIGNRTETDKLPYWWDVPEGKSVRVRYIPANPGSSRVEGNSDNFWRFALIYFPILALLVFVIVRLNAYFTSTPGEDSSGTQSPKLN